MKKSKTQTLLFLAGGIAYPMLEIVWRGHTHFAIDNYAGQALCSLCNRAVLFHAHLLTLSALLPIIPDLNSLCAIWLYRRFCTAVGTVHIVPAAGISVYGREGFFQRRLLPEFSSSRPPVHLFMHIIIQHISNA